MRPFLPLLGVLLLFASAPAQEGNRVLYAGGGANASLTDVRELSDGTVLAAGTADHLDWLAPETVSPLISAGIVHTGGSRVGFLLHLSGDLGTVRRALALPPGAVENLRWIRTTEVPGEPTGEVYVSGQTSSGYFVGRLDANFVNGTPAGFELVVNIAASGDHRTAQSWDVDPAGRLYAVEGGEDSAKVGFFERDGTRRLLPRLRGSHFVGGARQQGLGEDVAGATHSQILAPSDLQSWTLAEANAITPDGNGQLRKGTWPVDFVLHTVETPGDALLAGDVHPKPNGNSYGYNRYRARGKYRFVGLVVDRRSGDFYAGFNIQTNFYSPTPVSGHGTDVPDFEPAVIAYRADGALKWWSRLYHEAVDANGDGQIQLSETRLSEPDQYVDGLALDYSRDEAEGAALVVLARCHGNNVENLWEGHTVWARPGESHFQNRFTGTESNIHITWLGRLRLLDGVLTAATYNAGFFRKIISGKGNWPGTPLADPNLDGWPDPNVGWADVTSTRGEPNSLQTDRHGNIYLVGVGPRMITTATAHQKLPRRLGHNNPSLDEGTCPWNDYVRVYSWDLKTLVYSSALTGVWTYDTSNPPEPVGADNTTLLGVGVASAGLLVVGHHNASAGVARGNPIPVADVPAWGAAAPTGQTAILGRLRFDRPARPSGLERNAQGLPALFVDAFALGGGTAPARHRLPRLQREADQLALEFVRRTDRPWLRYILEESNDLAVWRAFTPSLEPVPDGTLPGGTERVRALLDLPPAGLKAWRVRVAP